MDSANWRNETGRLKWLSGTMAVAALVGLSMAPVQAQEISQAQDPLQGQDPLQAQEISPAQEIYRYNTGTYLREAITELRKSSPNYHKALDRIQSAVEELQAAIGTGELEQELGAGWMDRLTAVAGQVAADRLDGTEPWFAAVISKPFKRELLSGDALRAAGDYKEAIERYKHALPPNGMVK